MSYADSHYNSTDMGTGLTTGTTTGSRAYGPAGGTAVGMGAPGYGSPEETAATLSRLGVLRPNQQGYVNPYRVQQPPAVAPPRPTVTPAAAPPNPLTQGWSSLPMGPPQTTPAFRPPQRQGHVTDIWGPRYPMDPSFPGLAEAARRRAGSTHFQTTPAGLMNGGFGSRTSQRSRGSGMGRGGGGGSGW